MSESKLMTFQWDGISYGIMLEKLKTEQRDHQDDGWVSGK